MRASIFAVSLSAALCWSAAHSEVTVDPDGEFVALIGPIDQQVEADFLAVIYAQPSIGVVVLSSPGGDVASALDIAEAVHRLGLATFIPYDGHCESACSFIFFAGQERWADGPLGVHQFSGGRGEAALVESEAQFVVSEILDAFETFGVDWRVSQVMLTTLPGDMYYFSEFHLNNWGINTADVSSPQPEELPAANMSRFSNYPTEAIFVGAERVILPDFDGRDNWARSYRTRIRDGMAEGSTFAGHFNVIEIGCGTSCRFAFVGDVLTGEVFSFPYGGEEQYEMSLLFIPESRLLKARWANYELTRCIHHDLEFRDGQFLVVAEYTSPRVDFCNGVD